MKDRKMLKPEERLIVAADFKPTPERGSDGYLDVANKVRYLAMVLAGTGVYLKVNSALRAFGYDHIGFIRSKGLKVFADLKLYDIPETLATDGALLRIFKPELLTVVCSTGLASMQALKAELPDTEILGVTVLTSLTGKEVFGLHNCSLEQAVSDMANFARAARIGGIICSAKEAEMLRMVLGDEMTINTPAIRPGWATVKGDDQNQKRVMTPAEAIRAGADRIVVGRPIIQAEKPYDAVMRTIEEIASAVGQSE